MAGKIRSMIVQIVNEKSSGNELLASVTETKLILKGIDPKKYSAISDDDPEIIAKLEKIAAELGVKL